ncbi:MAG: DUF1552 domain-containing protein [Myxococcota bacterium]
MTSRRDFLKYAGQSAVLAPFWRMLSRPAYADTGTAKNLIIFHSPNGTIHDFWRPVGGETGFTFPSGGILEPLAAMKDRLVIIDGLDLHNATNHEGGMAAMLTNNGGGVTDGMSVDQYVAQAIGGGMKFASLEMGALTGLWGGGRQTRMSYGPGGSLVSPDDDPRNVFTRMYGDLAGDAAEVEQMLARRMSVLDLIRDEIDDLHGRLGTTERVKLDSHLASLRTVETQLSTTGVCEPGGAPEAMDFRNNDNFPAIAKLQMDLAVEAVACGLTRVASVQLSHTVSPVVPTWLGINDGHHALSHSGNGDTTGVGKFVTSERWFAEQFGYLLDQLALAEDPETGGSLLDSTVVLWAKEMGDPRAHVCTDTPFIIAGAPDVFTPGRYLRYENTNHAQLLVSICQAFGLTNTTFGNPAAGEGPLENL